MPVRGLSLIKLQAWRPEDPYQYYKETVAQVFFCELCEIFRKAFLQNTF